LTDLDILVLISFRRRLCLSLTTLVPRFNRSQLRDLNHGCQNVRGACLALFGMCCLFVLMLTYRSAVFGPVNGALKKFFAKLHKLQTKQDFSFAIIVGDLFTEKPDENEAQEVLDILNGGVNVPLPVYFGMGDHSLHARVAEKLEASGEICTNLFFLGRRGTLKTSEGVRIAALGGKLAEEENCQSTSVGRFDAAFTVSDARTLHGAHTTDVLITNQWPQGVRSGSKNYLPDDIDPPSDAQCISDLCAALKPKYHFSASAARYSREPFFHLATEDEAEVTRMTRFESLAPFNNQRKEKWVFAFELDPSAPAPTLLPTDVTPTPFTINRKRRALPNQNESYSRYGAGNGDTWRRPKKPRQSAYTKLENCFFCIGSPTLQTHLITSMADESYLTIPRGPLPLPGSNSDLGMPGHTLIIPHTHVDDKVPVEKRAHLSPNEYEEMQRYRRALCRMVQAKGNGKLGAVCWEISRSHIRHVHWQFVPVPSDLISKGLIQAGFKVAAENGNLLSFKKYDPTKMVTEKGDYFRIWIWKPAGAAKVPGLEQADDRDDDENGNEISMLMPIPSSERFDIQFGRKVMASLLGLGSRADWRDVVQTEAEETVDAEAFKAAFEPYDPALEPTTARMREENGAER
jgi:Protein similar to CwfJ C-terminus 1/Protein similar to CwfJ C-terminus 2